MTGKVRVFSGKIRSTMAIMKQDSSCDLEIRDGDPQQGKDRFPCPEKTDAHEKTCQNGLTSHPFSLKLPLSEVRETKMGRILKTLNATKRGVNGRKIFNEINCFTM
jgi:hypothetical protein